MKGAVPHILEAALFSADAQYALLVGADFVWRFPSLKHPVLVGGQLAFGPYPGVR